MIRVVKASEMKKIEKRWIDEIGVSSLALMENAASHVKEIIEDECVGLKRIHVFSGYGNNGGDGIAVARLLFVDGYDVSVSMIGNPLKISYECMRQIEIAKKLGIRFMDFNKLETDNYDLFVDAIFGIGLTRDVGGAFSKVIELINSNGKKVVAVDVPSGIDSDNGTVRGIAVKADYTVTIGIPKAGLFFYPGKEYAGKVYLANIGLNDVWDSEDEKIYLVEEKDVS
ncbi:MAG: NAD(P)H-hydrate epimerase, partial [Lachnospiraceae bacterium]|nr:NAD(P)H-hydrate epimerase [Lachnospiraceae bacterium]